MAKLTPQQITSCVDTLSQLEPGFLPLEIFNQIARLVRLPMVDVVPIRQEENRLQIGLIKREAEDLWWPNMWHLPGTVFRSTDTIESAVQRLITHELLIRTSDSPVFRGLSIHQTKRGAEVVLIHTVENCSFKEGSQVTWFPAEKLPETFVTSERNVVDRIKESLPDLD